MDGPDARPARAGPFRAPRAASSRPGVRRGSAGVGPSKKVGALASVRDPGRPRAMSSEAPTGWTSPASHGPRALPARLQRPNYHPRWARGGSEAASKVVEAQVTSWSRRRRKESLSWCILTRALRRPSEASDMVHVRSKPTSDTRSTRYSTSHLPHHGWRRRRRRSQDHQVGVICTSR